MKKILLTGASGTIGFEVLKQLYDRTDEYEVTIFDLESRKSKKKFAPYKDRVEIVYGNISNEDDLARIANGKDVVIHLAAIIPPLADEAPELTHQVNTVGTERLIRQLVQHSPNVFFLYSSSVSVYGDRLETPMINIGDELKASFGDEYAETKIEAEKILQNSNLNWSIFRLGAIMGGHKMSKLMFHQPLNTSMEIATAEDTARAFVHAIEKQESLSKQIFNLGGGESCRVMYDNFLKRSFEVNGLGVPNFPPNTFAEKNFHCGYYEDGDVLNDILQFRKDSLDDYFEKEWQKIPALKKFMISLFQKPIKKYLAKQSEPLIAYKENDQELINRFFKSGEAE